MEISDSFNVIKFLIMLQNGNFEIKINFIRPQQNRKNKSMEMVTRWTETLTIVCTVSKKNEFVIHANQSEWAEKKFRIFTFQTFFISQFMKHFIFQNFKKKNDPNVQNSGWVKHFVSIFVYEFKRRKTKVQIQSKRTLNFKLANTWMEKLNENKQSR